MTVALQVVGIVVFALLILASIALHELGHMLPAKRFGVKVTEYMIGFGPMLWSRKRGETAYGVKAVPLGGYCRMIGMFPPGKDDPEGAVRASTTGRLALLVEDARRQSLEEVAPADADRVFYKLPVRRRIVVMLGGPLMNLALATVLFAVVLVGLGVGRASATVDAVVPCTPTAGSLDGSAAAGGGCGDGAASAAAAAGLRPGDTVTALGGRPVSSWEELSAAVRAAGPGPTAVEVLRDGAPLTLTADLAAVPRPVLDDQGKATGQTQVRPFLGVSPTYEMVRQPVTAVPGYMWDITTASVRALVALPVRLWELGATLVTGGERDPGGPVSVVGVTRLGGEVAAADEPVAEKVAMFLSLAASLNLFLFLFNLIPLLPLDGGHVAGAVWEGVRRRLARWRGRPDPGPVDVARLLPVAYSVAVVLIGMSLVVIYADVVKPITLGG